MTRKPRQLQSVAVRKNTIEQWRLSGLSARQWCQQNAIPYSTFMRWCASSNKEESTLPSALSPSSFIEIVEAPSSSKNTNCSGVIIECQGINIHLVKGFDSTVLQNCIKVLKEGTCYR
jgi:hypothetical protein